MKLDMNTCLRHWTHA